MIEAQLDIQEILQFELEDYNIDLLLWYLNLLEDIFQFGGIVSLFLYQLNTKNINYYSYIITTIAAAVIYNILFKGLYLQKYSKEIETLLFHCFVHEENLISNKASKLLHKILLSLLSIYPKEIHCWN